MLNKNIELVSQTRKRLRFKSRLFKGLLKEEAEAAISKLPGVKSIKVNPVIGSVLVVCDEGVFDIGQFEPALNSLAEQNSEQKPTIPLEENKKGKSATVGKRHSLYRRLRKVENRGMAVFGTACLAGVITKAWHLHSWAGWIFAIASIAHTYRYRKVVW